jgi:5-methylcytosine-specific restriction enzyme B
MAGNIWSAPVLRDYTAWPRSKAEAEVIDGMNPGDLLIPKFAGSALTDIERNLPRFEEFARDIAIDPDEAIVQYEATVEDGYAALPYLLRVVDHLDDLTARGTAWARVRVEQIEVEHPLETKEFLRLRALPDEIAVQFKGMVSRGRHFQTVPVGTADAVRSATLAENRGAHLRQFSVVEAADPQGAIAVLQDGERSLLPGDLVLIVNAGEIVGLFGFEEKRGDFVYLEGKSPRSPLEIRKLFEEAALRKHKDFSIRMARQAISQILALLDSPSSLLAVDDYRGFYDPFRMLNRRITQALDVRRLPIPGGAQVGAAPGGGPEAEQGEIEESDELLEAEALEGLEVESVRAALPDGFEVAEEVLAEAVTALRAGKHLLLSGPPGTGKSTLAEALCRAVVKDQLRVATATADWTTFDTIGGYMPSENGSLHFEPGIVLRCLRAGGQWLVVDEINRADIDKAFGPLFSVLAGTGEDRPHQDIELPFQQDKKSVHIQWSSSFEDATGEYVVTPHWRLIGTLNTNDKASLFQLSFAFLRRFALVEVPVPGRDSYKAWFMTHLDDIDEPLRSEIATAAINLAVVKERELGPAILGDMARFINKALLESSTGQSVFDARTAFLAAVRLLAVAQYEGARPARIVEATKAITDVWPDPPDPHWTALRNALDEVALA